MHQLQISDLPSAKIVQEMMFDPNGWNLLYFAVSHEICPLFDISEPEIKEISIVSGHYKTFSVGNTTTEITRMTLQVTPISVVRAEMRNHWLDFPECTSVNEA